MYVVKIAMNTSMKNTDFGMIPSSKPMLITISSINARVFIITPIKAESFHDRPFF